MKFWQKCEFYQTLYCLIFSNKDKLLAAIIPEIQFLQHELTIRQWLRYEI